MAVAIRIYDSNHLFALFIIQNRKSLPKKKLKSAMISMKLQKKNGLERKLHRKRVPLCY